MGFLHCPFFSNYSDLPSLVGVFLLGFFFFAFEFLSWVGDHFWLQTGMSQNNLCLKDYLCVAVLRNSHG